MAFPNITIREYPADILTEDFVLTGQMAPFGPLLPYLNQSDRGILILKNVQATALDAGSQVETFQAEEMVIVKDNAIAVRLTEPVSQGTVHLLSRREKLIVFTPRFIIQGFFHCGPDVRVSDLFESTPGHWAAATEVHLHSLRPTRRPIFDTGRMLLLNKRHIQFYQPAK